MYRLLSAVADPLLVAMLFLGLVIGYLWHKRGANVLGMRILSALYLAMFVAFTPAAAYVFRATLEWRYPPDSSSPEQVEAIVVLTGYVYRTDETRTRTELGSDTMRRCILAAELYRESPPRVVIVSGGYTDPAQAEPSLAAAGKGLLLSLGVADKHLILEEESQTTSENAELTCRLLHERGIRRIALVTDATHLWRAELCFHHCDDGLEISTFGSGYRATHFSWQVATFLPNSYVPYEVGEVMHEWLGLAWYRLTGRI